MPLTIRETFEQYSSLDPSDKGLANRILRFEQYILNKSAAHTEFFGGNLIGFPIARWNTVTDDRKWLEEVCLVEDVRNCQQDLYECDYVERERNVTSNIFNLSIPWILNVLYRQDKKNGLGTPSMVATLVVGMTRHLTTFMKGRFEYGSDPAIAQSMFERLDNKTDFKVTGSWIALMRHRTELFLYDGGCYPDAWQDMNDDEHTLRMCQEVNGNMRTSVNILTSKYHDERGRHERIMTSSKIGQLDGEKVMKDYIRHADRMKDDLRRVCSDPNTLIKQEVLDSTLNMVSTTNERVLRNVLEYMSDNFNSKDDWQTISDEMVQFLLELSRRKSVDFSSVYDVTKHVSAMFRASGTNNAAVIKLKDDMGKMVKQALPDLREVKVAAARSGLVVYIAIRIMAIDYYK